MYDCAIIGCGVVGAAMAYTLARYDLNVVILEASNDVANVQTKANSAILHAGFDPPPGTLMAKTNVEGVRLAREICAKLDVPRLENGALILGFSREDLSTLADLYERGVANGVENLQLLDAKEVRLLESKVHDDVIGALYAPTSAIVDPWEYTIAMAETAIRNGVELKLEAAVTAIYPLDRDNEQGGFEILFNQESIHAKYIINCAGVAAADVHALIGGGNFRSLPARGQYFLLDKSAGDTCKHTLFQCPSALGKGILIAPTVHGNLIVGPNSERIEDAHDTAVTAEALAFVRRQAERSLPHLPFHENIRNFSGVRATTDQDDFIIEASPEHPAFINLAGIKSPGLSAAPSIALMGLDLLAEAGLELREKTADQFIDKRERSRFRFMTASEKAAKIAGDKAYSQIICRCETVSEGEILEAIHGIIPPRSIDAVKRRCNAGMGRCQGSFCGPRIHALLSEELGIPYEEVLQNEPGSFIVWGETKNGSEGGEA